MSEDYAGLSARCDIEVPRPGQEASRELLANEEFALILSDHDNDLVVVVEGNPAQLLTFADRAQQALKNGSTSPRLAGRPSTGTDATRHSGRCGRPPPAKHTRALGRQLPCHVASADGRPRTRVCSGRRVHPHPTRRYP
jgi:hypothetical protein